MKLFRGMRALSLASGNTSGYLKYALGEIVFVVVGILLAFQIDNWNTHRNSVLHAHHLYAQVQSELVLNIHNCNTVLAQYRGKDTLVHDILHREVTRQDYIDHLVYGLVLLTQEEVEVSSEAFLNLVNSQDVFAKDQGDIVLELKELYGNDKRDLDKLNKIATNNTLEYHKQFKNEQTWYADLFINLKVPDVMIDYCMEDPFYFNSMVHFHFINLRNHVRYTLNFRNRAIDIHERLADEMNLALDSTLVLKSVECQHLLGHYSAPDFNLNIVMEQDKLMGYQIDENTGVELEASRVYSETPDEFIFGDLFGRVVRDKAGAVSGLRLSLGRISTELVKDS